jgi:hypothetical protein
MCFREDPRVRHGAGSRETASEIRSSRRHGVPCFHRTHQHGVSHGCAAGPRGKAARRRSGMAPGQAMLPSGPPSVVGGSTPRVRKEQQPPPLGGSPPPPREAAGLVAATTISEGTGGASQLALTVDTTAPNAATRHSPRGCSSEVPDPMGPRALHHCM